MRDTVLGVIFKTNSNTGSIAFVFEWRVITLFSIVKGNDLEFCSISVTVLRVLQWKVQ